MIHTRSLIHTHACTHTIIHACTHTCIFTYTPTCTHTSVQLPMYTHANADTPHGITRCEWLASDVALSQQRWLFHSRPAPYRRSYPRLSLPRIHACLSHLSTPVTPTYPRLSFPLINACLSHLSTPISPTAFVVLFLYLATDLACGAPIPSLRSVHGTEPGGGPAIGGLSGGVLPAAAADGRQSVRL